MFMLVHDRILCLDDTLGKALTISLPVFILDVHWMLVQGDITYYFDIILFQSVRI